MADLKISELTNLTAADPANDMIPIVDVSATPPASGSTKRISINNILACSPTATLASATISGDLTVDTSTLKVDSANNRVGIGTASPHEILTVANTGGNVIQSILTSATGTGNIFFATSTAGANSYRGYLQYDQSLNSLAFGINSTTAMTLNSTGLGVGVASPTNKLDVFGNAGLIGTSGSKYVYFNLASDSNSIRGAKIGKNYDSPWDLSIHASTSASGLSNEAAIKFYRNLTDVSMTLDSSGNVGIGVTPAGTGGCLQLKSGITFPATQVASSDANTLDDYEEGTFTPTVVGSSTAGTATYATQSGRYVKIGRQVTAWIHLDWSGGTGTGNLRFGGLPFTIITLATNNYPSAAIGYINGIALSANNIAVAYGQNAENAVNLGQYPIGGGSGSSVAYDAAGQIIFTITYEV